jgi:NitT/TauT family transport system ATP-binding protein
VKSSVNDKTVLAISGLKFRYPHLDDQRQAINGLSLTINSSEIVCILGASGCGKSTLLNLISGLIKPQAGKIEFSDNRKDNHRIGYIFQDDALFPWRTVQDNLTLACEIKKEISIASAKERIAQYLKTFHLQTEILNQYPSQLSGGMRQRVSIIQSLMFDPGLLLLDEPFAALDFYTKLSLENEFYQLVKGHNKAAILVTHDIDEAIAMGDRVVIMAGGQFISQFPIDLGDGERLPETCRGTPRFAEVYRNIWSELKAVIAK